MMNALNLFAVDTHTEGQVLRVLLGGIPALKGNTLAEKRNYFVEHYDNIRLMTMLEPRGYTDMFGAMLVPPCDPEADFGAFFFDGAEFLNMCGDGTIAVCTVLVNSGMVPVTEPYTHVVLETVAGIVRVQVRVENGKAKSVTLQNVPAFVYKENVAVEVPDIGTIHCDIAFGGSFFALVPVSEIGADISPEQLKSTLIPKGMAILKAVNEQVPVQHPTLDLHTINLVEFTGPAKSADADKRGIIIYGLEQAGRSPCGTGTCARMALLHARGELPLDKEFVHESVLGTKFYGRLLAETKVGDYPAVVPQITGSAYITGYNHFVFDENDPVKFGIHIG